MQNVRLTHANDLCLTQISQISQMARRFARACRLCRVYTSRRKARAIASALREICVRSIQRTWLSRFSRDLRETKNPV